jgi:NaMN:DMB phosphoribosyltransferase
MSRILTGARRLVTCVLAFLTSTLLLAMPAFAQVGGDRVSGVLSNSLSYAQGLGIFAAGFLVIWAVANVARERPSGKQWAGAGGSLLLSSLLQLLRTFAG